MASSWPDREPLRRTLMRTGAIALVVGAVLARGAGGLARWPLNTLLVFWLSFGGHWVEVWFLDRLRPRLPASRAAQVGARLATWFVGGVVLGLGMSLTGALLGGGRPAGWIYRVPCLGGFALIGLELVVHLLLQLRRLPNFYDGRA